MSATKTAYVCTDCGTDTPRWQGQCPACEAWNTLVEERVTRKKSGTRRPERSRAGTAEVTRLGAVDEASVLRSSSGIAEFDFVLGGGLVAGSVILIGGEPGIGKSTLLLQAAARLISSGSSVLYVTGEESASQVRMRADRLQERTDDVDVLAETDLDRVLDKALDLRPDVLLIDSIQTVYSSDLDGVPGSVGQVRECAARFQRHAKERNTTIFLVGHVTKGGGLAGPKTLEHIVDTVLYFESAGGADHRVLRATKNRFGGVDEIGVFRMSAEGLVPVANPSELFLGERDVARSGCAVTAIVEGSRPLLLEIQALATRAPYGAPQRVAAGFDHKRLALLLAVLEKRVGMSFSQLDVFLNVVGGLRVTETSVDAAVAVALASTLRDQPILSDTVVLGEVGLGGELRPVSQTERRIAEAEKMGFRHAIVPARSRPSPGTGIDVRKVENVEALMRAAFD